MIGEITQRTATRTGANQEIIAFERTAEGLTTRYRFLLIGGICLVYLTVTLELARRKLIWTDEFFTLYLSRLNPRDLWGALLTGGDQHPPAFYLLHQLFLRSLGENPWALRLPAILGFLFMMLCVYQFVAKRTSVAYGLVGMLIPLATVAYEYAYEARGYSLLLCFLGLAVVSWQRAGDPGRRTGAVIGLAAGVTGGVLSHYYSVVLLPAIAVAEIVRSIQRRSWKPALWLALCVPVVPLIAFLRLIKSSTGFAATFWGKGSLHEINLYYENILGSAATCILCCFAGAGLWRALTYRKRTSAAGRDKTFPVAEIVLAVALAAAPIIGYLFGKTATGVFVWRYAIGGVVGMAILFGFGCFKIFRGSVIAGWLIAAVIATSFAITARATMRTLADRQASLHDLIAWLDTVATDREPLVIADSQSFYALSYYSPPWLKARCIYLADAARSLKYLGHDTPDRSLSALAPWFGLNVNDYAGYLASHAEMKVWVPPNEKWSWLLPALIDDGQKLTIIGRNGTSILYSVAQVEAPVER